MDLVILIILIGIVIFFFKNIESVITFLGIAEIFFRIIHAVGDKLKVEEFDNLVNQYLPESIPNLLSKYSSGLLLDLLFWGFIIVMVIFEFNIIKSWIKKKK